MVIAALIQSIFQNTVYFLNVGEDENVYKYFIYLTNNARYDHKFIIQSRIIYIILYGHHAIFRSLSDLHLFMFL